MKTTLSKSKYIAGLQCPRRLWLGCHASDLGTPATARLAAVLDQGAEIGRRALHRAVGHAERLGISVEASVGRPVVQTVHQVRRGDESRRSQAFRRAALRQRLSGRDAYQ